MDNNQVLLNFITASIVKGNIVDVIGIFDTFGGEKHVPNDPRYMILVYIIAIYKKNLSVRDEMRTKILTSYSDSAEAKFVDCFSKKISIIDQIRELKKIVNQYPDFALGYFYLSNFYYEVGNLEKSVQSLENGNNRIGNDENIENGIRLMRLKNYIRKNNES